MVERAFASSPFTVEPAYASLAEVFTSLVEIRSHFLAEVLICNDIYNDIDFFGGVYILLKAA